MNDKAKPTAALHAYADERGRSWRVVVTPDGAADVLRQTGFDLTRGADYDRLAKEPALLAAVLFALCAEQAAAAGVEMADFFAAHGGPAIHAAAGALATAVAEAIPGVAAEALTSAGFERIRMRRAAHHLGDLNPASKGVHVAHRMRAAAPLIRAGFAARMPGKDANRGG